ncbi:MAG: hypothetical protein LKJ69_09425 [Lactobacillus sp.]|jgi:hypothetical protein|nr:hypothetical protein [Lactobacillus sp.]MCI2033583.1 hypothetical protein [Lactobacillus sp.]
MKKFLLGLGTLITIFTLSACGQKISSNYAGVDIGDSAAKKMTAVLPDGKAAAKAVDTYEDDDSSKNHEAAVKAIDKFVDTCKDNSSVSDAASWKIMGNVITFTEKSNSAKNLRTAISIASTEFISDVLPKRFGDSHEGDKVSKQYDKIRVQFDKDLGIKK